MSEHEDLAPRAEDARPVVGFRVGVTGHRKIGPAAAPDIGRAIDGVLADLEEILRGLANSTAARDLYQPRQPLLRLISPLAEGADRLAANIAVKRHWRLAAPLPFPREEYERDFPQSVAEFRTLLAHAEDIGQVLDLDGARERETEAYLQVGRFVLDQSDLLIAVWDGEPPAGEGGTGQIVEEARAAGVPVVHIAVTAPYPVRLLAGPDEPAPYQRGLLEAHIRSVLLPEWRIGARDHARAAIDYLRQEAVRSRNEEPDFLYLGPFAAPVARVGRLFPRFIRKLGGRARSTQRIARALPPAGTHNPVVRALFLHFQRADVLATHYASVHRSGFMLIYFLGATSLVAAFAAITLRRYDLHRAGWCASAIELLSLLLIAAIFLIERKNRWRERWLDYRLLAEMLREADLLAQIGVAPPTQSLDQLDEMHPERGWVAWLVAAIGRSVGIVAGQYDTDYLVAMRDYAAETRLADQIAYHERTEKQNAAVSKRLRGFSQFLFGLTVVAIIAELILRSSSPAWLGFLAGFFPAIAVASFGIRNQAEFEIVVHRSSRLRERLSRECDRMRRIDGPRLTSAALREGVRQSAHIMRSDTIEWAAIFEVKESEIT